MSSDTSCWSLRGLQNRAESAMYDAQQERIDLAAKRDRLAEKAEENKELRVVLQMALLLIIRLIEQRGPDADLSADERKDLGLDLDALYLS